MSDWTPVVLVLRSGQQVRPKCPRLEHEHPPFEPPEAWKGRLRQIHLSLEAEAKRCWCCCLGQWVLEPPPTYGVWPREAAASSCRPWRGNPEGRSTRGESRQVRGSQPHCTHERASVGVLSLAGFQLLIPSFQFPTFRSDFLEGNFGRTICRTTHTHHPKTVHHAGGRGPRCAHQGHPRGLQGRCRKGGWVLACGLVVQSVGVCGVDGVDVRAKNNSLARVANGLASARAKHAVTFTTAILGEHCAIGHVLHLRGNIV